jgi:DnaJ-class molecular chaperone
VHPDKNKAPSAEKAFKKIGQAYGNLSDPQKRKHYDMFGSEQGAQPGMGGGFSGADFNPDEIFRQMF